MGPTALMDEAAAYVLQVSYRLEADCTGQSQTRCEACIKGKEYQSQANSLKTCEPCTSCDQPNANLEVDTKCTAVSDATCKCKENHYCPSGKKPCKICEPCQVCGSEGIKVECSATNNTICNDKPSVKLVVQPVSWQKALLLLCVYDITTFYRSILNQVKGSHIPEIAGKIGWKTMKNLAMTNNISNVKIEDIEQNYPNDSSERTNALLREWEEKEGRNASQKLVDCLKKMKEKKKLEEVLEILK
ncbi:hypothetical protein WMY93_017401 [Mugilogobius chulae]|uniref:Apoptosis-mediating surface antigen FAS n=1 Tax=Mugilogobius chulae TaxID=88201 RepID=A0AAW0NUM7_9GOBI